MNKPITVQDHDSLVVNSANLIDHQDILTPLALRFIEMLTMNFAEPLQQRLNARVQKQAWIDQGMLPDFLPETAHIREQEWQVDEIPKDLLDRRVEITGPVDRKMVINALNANVKVFMADFEDSFAPVWDEVIQGQRNLRDANQGNIEFTHPETGKQYQLSSDPAVLICRVRGLHLVEKHLEYQGRAIPAALCDFALYFHHNYQVLLDKGSAPYFYLPKLQSHQEAKWWSDVFSFTEKEYGLPQGTIKATVLIETLPAVFEMDEILFALKEHIVGLNCGRWDYIFSYIKTFKNHPDRILPDRQAVTMRQPFLNAYSRLLIRTCHRRGAFAMGGMAALIPNKDPQKNTEILQKITEDKQIEANNGHDGTWIAHPGLATAALNVFDPVLGARTNQLNINRLDDEDITADQLLAPCSGERTEVGMRHNIRVAVQYLEAWISGQGCVPIYGLMEDAATAEISRASIWQWIQHKQLLSNGKLVTPTLFETFLAEEMQVLKHELGETRFEQGRFDEAAQLMTDLTISTELSEFLTLSCYEHLA